MFTYYYEDVALTPEVTAFWGFYSIILIAFALCSTIGLWKVFKKAGEPGWAAIVPIYNSYVIFKITWGNGWKFLLMLIPLANIVFCIMTVNKLAKAFDKNIGFTIGLILVQPVFLLILGFGTARYVGVPGKQVQEL